MSEWNSCPSCDDDCNFSGFDELALTHKVMELIARFSRDQRIDPCPLFLRDTMLAVSALLHLEGEKIAATGVGMRVNFSQANRTFTQAARERFNAVLEADATRAAWHKH